jgi:hypothetical protein
MPKAKFKTYEPGHSPTEIASAAGCSRPIVYRLLARGLTRDQIVERFASRTMRQTNEPGSRQPARAPRNGKTATATATATPTPEPGTNTGGANGSESFADAQRRKESALADERQLRVGERRGALVPIVHVNAHFAGVIVKSRDILLRIGPELGDQLAAESNSIRCAELVNREVLRALGVLRLFGERHARAMTGSGPCAQRVQELARQIIAELEDGDRTAPPEVSQ